MTRAADMAREALADVDPKRRGPMTKYEGRMRVREPALARAVLALEAKVERLRLLATEARSHVGPIPPEGEARSVDINVGGLLEFARKFDATEKEASDG